jgi:hypothetical protein
MKKLLLVLGVFAVLVTGFSSCIVAPHPYYGGGYYAPHPWFRPWGYYGGYHGGWHGGYHGGYHDGGHHGGGWHGGGHGHGHR